MNEHTDRIAKKQSSSIAYKHETTFDDVFPFLLFAQEVPPKKKFIFFLPLKMIPDDLKRKQTSEIGS